jgi:hypothetical protein
MCFHSRVSLWIAFFEALSALPSVRRAPETPPSDIEAICLPVREACRERRESRVWSALELRGRDALGRGARRWEAAGFRRVERFLGLCPADAEEALEPGFSVSGTMDLRCSCSFKARADLHPPCGFGLGFADRRRAEPAIEGDVLPNRDAAHRRESSILGRS